MRPYLHHVPHPHAPTVLVLPGVNSGPYLFHGAFPTLGKTHALLVLNAPGCGGTPLRIPLTAKTYAEAALETLNDMNIQQPIALLGHSLGSFAAQELARMAPNRISRMVLASTSIGQPYMARDTLKIREHTGMNFWDLSRAIGKDPTTHMKHFFGPAFPIQHPKAYQAFLKLRAENLPPKNVATAQFAAGGAFSSYHWVHTIQTPTLVLQGGADILTPPASARKVAQFMPNARYLEFYGVGHFPMLEHEGFYPAIHRFLTGHAEGAELQKPPTLWERFQRSWMNLHG